MVRSARFAYNISHLQHRPIPGNGDSMRPLGAPHRRRLTPAAVFLLLALLATGGFARADMPHPDAPRLLNYYLRDDIAGLEAQLAQWDAIVLPYRLFDLKAASFPLLRQHNPDQRILLYFDPMAFSDKVEGVPGELHHDFLAGVDSLWLARTPEGTPISFWAGTLHGNISEHCPEVGGQTYREYVVEFLTTRIHPLIADGSIDGIFLDEMSQGGWLWWQPEFEGCFDYDVDLVCDEPDSIQAVLREAVIYFGSETAAGLPAGGLIMGNNCRPYLPELNGKLFEAFPSDWEAGVTGSLNNLDLWTHNAPPQSFNAFNAIPNQLDDRREFRHLFTASLLGDCYFSWSHDTGDHYQLDWFELFDFDLGEPLAARYAFGETPAFTADFESGLHPDVLAVPGASTFSLTTDPAEVLSGTQSLRIDTQTADPWPPLLELTLPGGFQGGEWYTVAFQFDVLDCLPEGSELLLKTNIAGACDQVLAESVPVLAGDRRQFRARLLLEDCDDYRIYLKAKGDMSLLVDSLTVVEGPGGMLVRDYERGRVVCNDSGESRALPFDPNWEVVDADQQGIDYAPWASGLDILIPHGDGIVFEYTPQDGDLRLNEFLLIDGGHHPDEAGENEPWVELFNRGETTLSLDGLFLSDDLDDSTRWPLPDMVLAPGEFVVFWCDGEPAEGPLHANFRPDDTGGTLALFDRLSSGNIRIDRRDYGAQAADTSRGRVPDGFGVWQSCAPTPGWSNLPATASPDAPGLFALRNAYPNPFNPVTMIAFSLAADGPVELNIYDVRGRLVDALVDGPLPAGEHRMRWNGEDARGEPVASGVYLLRLRAGAKERSQRLILLR